MIEKYINTHEILHKLITIRCKYAEDSCKQFLVDNLSLSKKRFNRYSPTKQEIYDLFPPRKQWVRIGYERRKDKSQCQRNELSLKYTIDKFKKKGLVPNWMKKLDEYIQSIIKMAFNPNTILSTPQISMIEKSRKKTDEKNIIVCRPICTFPTKEKIVLSLYNHFFTAVVDEYFYEGSFAFRMPKDGRSDMAHLDAIKKIIEYRKEHLGTLYVAECDMQKFFDTLDHNIVKKRVNEFIGWCRRDGIINTQERNLLRNIIFSYIDCFDFYKNIYKPSKKSGNNALWRNIHNGKDSEKVIEWVEKLESNKKLLKNKRFGIPQGGALSGVIVNIIMHFVDMSLSRYTNDKERFCYIRFCDDMIMISTETTLLNNAFGTYVRSIHKEHLFDHPTSEKGTTHIRDFWKGKTRKPYKWGCEDKESFRWITFVGFDVSYDGKLRIRKKTIEKEIKKQYTKVEDITRIFHNNKRCRYYLNSMVESLTHRLIGMSVGRVELWNYKDCSNKLSWAKAFSILDDNPYAVKQLKRLDNHRMKMISRFRKIISIYDFSDSKPAKDGMYKERNIQNFIGKPFSYYGQVLKKW